MRELREFRVRHEPYREAGIAVAGVSRDQPQVNRRWAAELELPYPMLSDRNGDASRALGLIERVGLGSWHVELQRRTTLLVDVRGCVAAAWGKVKIRGHADEVLPYARAARSVA